MAHLMSLIPSLGALRSDWFMSPAAILDVCRLHKYIYIYTYHFYITAITCYHYHLAPFLPTVSSLFSLIPQLSSEGLSPHPKGHSMGRQRPRSNESEQRIRS